MAGKKITMLSRKKHGHSQKINLIKSMLHWFQITTLSRTTESGYLHTNRIINGYTVIVIQLMRIT